jgi:hypothetical protein
MECVHSAVSASVLQFPVQTSSAVDSIMDNVQKDMVCRWVS